MGVTVLSSNRLAALLSAALLAGYLLGKWGAKAVGAVPKNESGGGGAFVLMVTLKFTSEATRDTFLKLIEPVCKDVARNERETTLSYQVAISDKDPLMVLVIERYADKERSYLEKHKSGTEFLQYREKLKAMQEAGDVEIAGESYIETDLGYV
ncbi:hypothetical protein ACHAXT_009019 [Thalassiosira profunda]